MSDYIIKDVSLMRDQSGLYYYQLAQELAGLSVEEAAALAARAGRDKNRTPTQWENSPNAGFSPEGVTTWLPVNPDYASGINVAEQEITPDSLLNFYKRALQMRRRYPALIVGDYQPLAEESESYYAFLRTTSEQRCLVLLNMTAQDVKTNLILQVRGARMVFSTHPHPTGKVNLQNLVLSPFEALIVELS